eukprot:SAG22_NODE_739_length_7523_cov_6.844558_1_plen_209_part_00
MSSLAGRAVPQFDPLLEQFPLWKIPGQYSLMTILVTILTLQNMGACQCSLLGFFEKTAPTTKVAALVAFITFPVGYIVYIFVTLKGAMVPTSRCRQWAMKLGTIDPTLKPDDLIFVYSIPPELAEKPHIEPPEIGPELGPDEAKEVLEKHAAIVKAQLKQVRLALPPCRLAALPASQLLVAGQERAGAPPPHPHPANSIAAATPLAEH